VHIYKHWINLDDKPKKIRKKLAQAFARRENRRQKEESHQSSTNSSFRRGSEMVLFVCFFLYYFQHTTNLKFKEGKTFSFPLPVS
jgi:hypothetical protein